MKGPRLIERFEGERGAELLVDTLLEQKIVAGNKSLAEAIASLVPPVGVTAGSEIIRQGTATNDLFLIVAGAFDIIVNGRTIARRSAGDHVGEMSAVQPTLRRSATVRAAEDSVVATLTEAQLSELAQAHPQIWRVLAKELARRLEQRNRLVLTARDRVQVFIVSSAEALPIARAIQNALAHDPFNVTVWTDGVFRASSFPIASLEAAVDQSDFAIAIVQPDDVVTTRGKEVVTPRDNVIFELGLFIGRLGLRRSFLVEPRGEETKLPSDLIGVTTISYRHLPQNELTNRQALATAIAPACNEIRDIINELGPNN
jgi:predicted nucleotide-binding protein